MVTASIHQSIECIDLPNVLEQYSPTFNLNFVLQVGITNSSSHETRYHQQTVPENRALHRLCFLLRVLSPFQKTMKKRRKGESSHSKRSNYFLKQGQIDICTDLDSSSFLSQRQHMSFHVQTHTKHLRAHWARMGFLSDVHKSQLWTHRYALAGTQRRFVVMIVSGKI